MRSFYAALLTYASLHGDLPCNDSGEVSIDPLTHAKTQREVGITSSTLICPADHHPAGPSYLLNPALSLSDFGRDSTTVVACDKPPNHSDTETGVSYHSDGTGFSLILIGDGTVRQMALPLKDRERWLRLFLAGDKRASNYPEDGNWYLGTEGAKEDDLETPVKSRR